MAAFVAPSSKTSKRQPFWCCVLLIDAEQFLFLPDVPLFFRDNGLKAIENLMEKKGKFDYILLETTGLADPGIIHSALLKKKTQKNSLYFSTCL